MTKNGVQPDKASRYEAFFKNKKSQNSNSGAKDYPQEMADSQANNESSSKLKKNSPSPQGDKQFNF